ncbi:MAG: hypothetical protein LBJ80_00110 [Rickettsiales bacterium]|jgi:hypothetical protein|nr:hypothetical protein [Rickettsiales bacterium]
MAYGFLNTDVDISNKALLLIHQPSIDRLNDNSSIQAKSCNLIYENARLSLLENYDWTFATKREGLDVIENGDVSATGYPYVYSLPNDFVRLIYILDSSGKRLMPPYSKIDPYLYENKRIYCAKAPIYDEETNDEIPSVFAQYVYDFQRVDQMPEYFKNCIALRMALELSKTFDDSNQYIQMLNAEYASTVNEARTIDAQQALLESHSFYGDFDSDPWSRV